MKTPYRFTYRKDKKCFYVTYRHIPGRWFSTGMATIEQAVLYAEDELRRGGVGKISTMPMLEVFTKGIFSTDDPYGIRRRNQGRNLVYSDSYYRDHQSRLEHYILPTFGKHLLDSITDVAIEDWLLSLFKYDDTKTPLSDDSRNKVLMCFRLVMQEAKRQGYVDRNPAAEVRMINARNKRRRDIEDHELVRLFPSDRENLMRIWLNPMWAAYFLVFRDTGFRPGEVAGLQKRNYYPELHGIFTDQSVDYQTRKLKQSIKTTNEGQKYKAGILTSLTCEYLDELSIDMDDDDFFFLIDGRLLCPEVSNKHLKGACKRAGVDLAGRTQYSLRHSFETGIAGLVENKVLIELMGHTSFRKEYDHRKPKKILTRLQPVREILEGRAEEVE